METELREKKRKIGPDRGAKRKRESCNDKKDRGRASGPTISHST